MLTANTTQPLKFSTVTDPGSVSHITRSWYVSQVVNSESFSQLGKSGIGIILLMEEVTVNQLTVNVSVM